VWVTPEPDAPLDLDDDEDLISTPPAIADAAVRQAVAWVDSELVRLRAERKERDRTGLTEIARMKVELLRDRKAINADIARLVTEQERLARLVRVLDRK
jgi:hypothetical protein